MPSSEAETPVVDDARTELAGSIEADLGDAVVATHLEPGRELWIRVAPEAWADLADYLSNKRQYRFFDWLSAIDWLPSPFGRSMDSEVDKTLGRTETKDAPDPEMVHGYTGGDTRFQVMARVYSLDDHTSLTLKVDVPDESLSVPTWTNVYPGANWHEREAAEMYGISFDGHPGLRKLYLPGDFEGHPLRKDFPLLSRMIKPWPGIVDVEPIPTADNPEDAS